MKRKFWLIAGIIVLVGFALLFFSTNAPLQARASPIKSGTSASSESYSGLCIRCLQQISGVDKSFLGIRYFHEERMVSGNGGLMSPSIFGPQLPAVDPHTYVEIFGGPCKHQFVRTGFCRYGGGFIRCGTYGGWMGYGLRLSLVQSLYLTFHRIPDKKLAQKTYALIDRLYPIAKKGEKIDRPMQSVYEADALPDQPLSILLRGLSLVCSKKDWLEVLDAAEAGNGCIDLLNNRELLINRLKETDPAVRRQAVDSLAARKEPEAWSAVATVLEDPEVGKEAARQILWNRCFEQYDRVLEVWQAYTGHTYEPGEAPRSLDFSELEKRLTDSEIRILLSQKKPRVDRLCFDAIRVCDRFSFLEEILQVLNERPSPEAEQTIKHLIAGPYPDLFREQKTREPVASPWKWLQEQNKGLLELNTPARSPTDRLMRQAMELGWSTGTWEKWRDIFEGWMAENAAQGYSAAFAEAMYAADPLKTAAYLNARLETTDEHWGNSAMHVLTGMGTIGIPEFLPAIAKFVERSKGGNYEKHPYYRIYVDYALHRCRQIPHWKLVSVANGKHAILRTDGTFIR
jgi:hypothetical protein